MVLLCAGRAVALSELLSLCPNGFRKEEMVRESGAFLDFCKLFSVIFVSIGFYLYFCIGLSYRDIIPSVLDKTKKHKNEKTVYHCAHVVLVVLIMWEYVGPGH